MTEVRNNPDYAVPGGVDTRPVRRDEARRRAQAAVEAGPTPEDIQRNTPREDGSAPNIVPRGPGHPSNGGRGHIAGATPTPATAPARPTPSRPASTPRSQSGRRSAPYEGDADTRALNNISYDLAKGVQGPPAPGREAATRNIAGAMGFAKGGLVRHTPGWSFGKSNSSTGNGKYAKGKGK